jgi:DNA-directed RNA polymerase subunit M/transcription elongation factor TFIIS
MEQLEFDKLIPRHPQRKKVYERFLELLKNNVDITLYDYDLQKMSLNIERGIFNGALTLYSKKRINETWNTVFKHIYLNKAVIIYDNLNPNGKIENKNLLDRLLSKEFTEFEMCNFPPDKIYPERYNYLMDLYCPDRFKDIPKKMERPDGLFKCGKCKSYKTEYTEKQTRSADEPTTKFCYCHNCGNRWRFC